jgi:hypothetical protein
MPAYAVAVLVTVALVVVYAVAYITRTHAGLFWVGYQGAGGRREFLRCPVCGGPGVMMVTEQADGTTLLEPIPRHMRAEVSTPDGGYTQAGQANAVRCMRCGGMGATWAVTGPGSMLRMPFPWPWRR